MRFKKEVKDRAQGHENAGDRKTPAFCASIQYRKDRGELNQRGRGQKWNKGVEHRQARGSHILNGRQNEGLGNTSERKGGNPYFG